MRGTGRVVGNKRVEVTARDGTVTEVVDSTTVVISTGTISAVPSVPGLAESAPWDSRVITNLIEPPESPVAVGAGVVAVEMAQATTDPGTREVTTIERNPRLLAREENSPGT
ncbi:MAG: FAD-dependent oxidoreductase [Chloroflexi bacterium]|nr:FAD-dependent oxidoreductase [Chloroflexota bacterium]